VDYQIRYQINRKIIVTIATHSPVSHVAPV